MNNVYAPVTLAPREYRYALDAAMTVFGPRTPLVQSNVPELTSELRWRIPQPAEPDTADAVLWVEPLSGTWAAELRELARALPHDAPLVIVASRPLAKRLPERRSWNKRGLGLQIGGISRLVRGLTAAGLRLEHSYGMHAATSVALTWFAGRARRAGRPDWGDRLQAAARDRYCTAGALASYTTVALLIARKECEDHD